MNAQKNTYATNSLPIKSDLRLIYLFSLLIALLMAIVSVAGLLSPDAVYPTEDLQQSFIPTDVINLFIGLPILFGSMWFTQRGKLIGLLFWPGALFFVFYHYMVYVFAMPLSWVFVLELILVTMTIYTLIGLVSSIDGQAVQKRISGFVPERLSGGVLAIFGGLFALRVLGVLVGALVNQTSLPRTELALQVADFLLTFAWIIGGVLIWRRIAFGYVIGIGLLFQASMLFIGLIIFLFLQPVLTTAPFAFSDILAVFIMGLIAFIPFGLFIRGVISAHDAETV